jgi:nucleoside-diphosphate-sugar epimerase
VKALVTGGAGFIGSHLSDLLLAGRVEVFALDDLSTGSRQNVEHLMERRDFHLVVDSVLSRSVVNELVHKCDVVYHLAAAAGVRLIVEQPVRTLVVNLQRTENVLEECNRFDNAGADRVHLRGLRRPPRGAPARGGRPPHLWADHAAPPGLRGLEGDG